MFLDSKVRDNIFELMDGLWLYQIEKTINHIESEQNRRSMFVESPQDAGDYGIFPIKMPINSESTSFSTEMLKRKRSKQLQGVFKIHFGEELAARKSPLFPFFFSSEIFKLQKDYPIFLVKGNMDFPGYIYITKHFLCFNSAKGVMVR